MLLSRSRKYVRLWGEYTACYFVGAVAAMLKGDWFAMTLGVVQLLTVIALVIYVTRKNPNR